MELQEDWVDNGGVGLTDREGWLADGARKIGLRRTLDDLWLARADIDGGVMLRWCFLPAVGD